MSVCNKKKFFTYGNHRRKSAFFTNLVPPSQTVRPHRSSCRPRWSPLQISWPVLPCHRSAGAHTRCLWPQTGPGTPWNSRRSLETLLRWVIPGLKGGECLSKRACALFLLLVDLLEDVFEATVILFQDGVLGAEVQRPAFGQGHLEGAVSKIPDGLVRVVHSHGNTTSAWKDTEVYAVYTGNGASTNLAHQMHRSLHHLDLSPISAHINHLEERGKAWNVIGLMICIVFKWTSQICYWMTSNDPTRG